MGLNVFHKVFNYSVLAAGVAALVYAIAQVVINHHKINLGFLLLAVFTLMVASRMELEFPRSRLTYTFADSMVFLTFLLYGGEFAIILASVEVFTNSIRIKSRKKTDFPLAFILFNVATIAISTAATNFAYRFFLAQLQTGEPHLGDVSSAHLISLLGVMALTQFAVNTALMTIFLATRNNQNVVQIWLDRMLPSSITYIGGAGLAGVIYKLITYADPIATSVIMVAIGLAYFAYRRSIAEINNSFDAAEKAERAKSEAERQRAEQAEKHVNQLNTYLKEQERISDALRKSKEAFQYSAMHDSLTDVANRAFLLEQLKASMEKAKSGEADFSVLFMDLKRFKNINDSLGHSIGDKLLIMVAKRLQGAVRENDVVARLGGDEFAVVLNEIVTPAENIRFAKSIHQKISQPFILQGNKVFIGLHIGIAPCDPEYDAPEEILRDADIAMHHAKKEEVPIAVFDKELRSQVLNAVKIESDLRFAVQRKELVLYYQPIVNLQSGRLAGFEALLRWKHPERGLVPPYEFIPIAEESGLIIPMTGWILNEACRQMRDWQNLPQVGKNLMVSVNLSGRHLTETSLVNDVRRALEKNDLDPNSLKLEVTESIAMQNINMTVDTLTKLKELGVRLSMDDFGTGYSSLSQLHRLPFDTLKIDRSFVSNVKEDGEDGEILWTIISLAKNLNLKIIAEGIETPDQLKLLRMLKCDYGQGYLLARPLPKEDIEQMMMEKTSWFPENFHMDDMSTELPERFIDIENQLRIF